MPKGKTYSEKLKDPRWQKKRLQILQRDEWACRHCESKEKTLHVHHCFYRPGADPWDYPDKSLVTLCEECHDCESVCDQYIEEILKLGVLKMHVCAILMGLWDMARYREEDPYDFIKAFATFFAAKGYESAPGKKEDAVDRVSLPD